MPLNEKKIISIILEESNKIEERCEGYREELIIVISEILEYERQHIISATNIQRKISDKFNATAQFLSNKRKQYSEKQEIQS